ncbi:hypothetical protein [Phenylobacterium sp.]|uniref:hypothetical protein n=1 Tax=Phenylobacterium sp. TaxID=1871053 RepID=UPI0025EA15EF|nr:hypothetical protein [Phenylobacterium sp.]
MSTHTIFILGLILFDGVAVGLAIWQYWTVRPTKQDGNDEASALARASAKDPGHPEG